MSRYHSKALLVTFDSDNTSGSHVDVLTREVQEGFKRLDGDIRAMGTADGAGEDDAQVGGWRLGVQWGTAYTCASFGCGHSVADTALPTLQSCSWR